MEATPRGTADLPSRTIERCTGINSNTCSWWFIVFVLCCCYSNGVQYYSVSFSFRCKEDRLFITRSSDKLWEFKLSPYHDDFWINISFFGKEYQLKKRVNQELVSQESNSNIYSFYLTFIIRFWEFRNLKLKYKETG